MKYFTLSLLLFLTGYTTPPHIREANRIMNTFSDKMKANDYSLFKSGGAMMDDIQVINLGFHIEKTLTIEEARIILLSKANFLINLINTDLKIRPHLRNYPFTLANVDLSFMFFQNNENFVNPPFIAVAYTSSYINKIVYTINDPIKDKLITIHEESFEDALQIYNNHKQNNPNNNL